MNKGILLDFINLSFNRFIIRSDIYNLLNNIKENKINIDSLNKEILNHNNNTTFIMKYNKFCNIILN
jgi:hypothetical protein